ncbi:MAG: UDP-3-O-(3-hydroxymyristoyl)glucosamine N-acyltransferase [Elusimicrobia bacterium]|nr:UDP-3-O-(3-hydroxymyristoyl)glucosamine N-acyltransferase [Elusimicrobiota bacterium]
MPVTAGKIAEFLGAPTWGDPGREVTLIAKFLPGQKGSLSFCKWDKADFFSSIELSVCAVVICPQDLPETALKNKTLIPVPDARLAFIKSANHFFPWRKFNPGIDPTAIIAPGVKIDPAASIGPYCIIKEGVSIGAQAKLSDRVTVHSNCRIGNNVIIGSGTVVGQDGFGYMADEQGNQMPFPHMGAVVIEDGVEIGANVCIDRGALDDTLIKYGTKIDNLVHVAHNVVIGRNCLIVCLAGIGGSVVIGDNSYIGLSAVIKNQKKIGSGVMIGMGAVVVKDVPDNATVVGNPARLLEKQALKDAPSW